MQDASHRDICTTYVHPPFASGLLWRITFVTACRRFPVLIRHAGESSERPQLADARLDNSVPTRKQIALGDIMVGEQGTPWHLFECT